VCCLNGKEKKRRYERGYPRTLGTIHLGKRKDPPAKRWRLKPFEQRIKIGRKRWTVTTWERRKSSRKKKDEGLKGKTRDVKEKKKHRYLINKNCGKRGNTTG